MTAVTGDEPEFTHTTEEGEVQIVDVSGKPDVHMKSTASGSIELSPSTVAALEEGAVEMEALNGVSRALHTVWDVVKSHEKDRDVVKSHEKDRDMVKSHEKDLGGEYPTTEITGVSVDEKTKTTLEEEKLCRP